MDNKTMDRMVVEIAVNAARVEGMEAMREAAARVVEPIYGRTPWNDRDEQLLAYRQRFAKAIRALKTEEVLK